MSSERIEYPHPKSRYWEQEFYYVVEFALEVAGDIRGSEPLTYLEGAIYPGDDSARQGATYKSLAYIAHRLGMSKEDRQNWYGVARGAALSQAHAGTIIARLNERDELYADLDKLAAAT